MGERRGGGEDDDRVDGGRFRGEKFRDGYAASESASAGGRSDGNRDRGRERDRDRDRDRDCHRSRSKRGERRIHSSRRGARESDSRKRSERDENHGKRRKEEKKKKKKKEKEGKKEKRRRKKDRRRSRSRSRSVSSHSGKEEGGAEEAPPPVDLALSRNVRFADALRSLLGSHPALSSDLPIMLVRMADGASFDLTRMEGSASRGLDEVFLSLSSLGVRRVEGGDSWIWSDAPRGGGGGGRSRPGAELVLVKVVRALLDEIGVTADAVNKFERRIKKEDASGTTAGRGGKREGNHLPRRGWMRHRQTRRKGCSCGGLSGPYWINLEDRAARDRPCRMSWGVCATLFWGGTPSALTASPMGSLGWTWRLCSVCRDWKSLKWRMITIVMRREGATMKV